MGRRAAAVAGAYCIAEAICYSRHLAREKHLRGAEPRVLPDHFPVDQFARYFEEECAKQKDLNKMVSQVNRGVHALQRTAYFVSCNAEICSLVIDLYLFRFHFAALRRRSAF